LLPSRESATLHGTHGFLLLSFAEGIEPSREIIVPIGRTSKRAGPMRAQSNQDIPSFFLKEVIVSRSHNIITITTMIITKTAETTGPNGGP
jgi:hypothetical protein